MHQRCPHGLWVVRIKRHINSAGVFVFEKDFLPCRSAVTGAEDATFRAWAVSASHGRDEYDIGILRINGNAADMARRVETDVLPRLSAVSGFINAIAIRQVGTEIGFTGAYIDDRRIRLRHGNRANRRNGLAVKGRLPGDAAIRGLPHATAYTTEIVNVWLAFNSSHGNGASTTVRADHAPTQTVI